MIRNILILLIFCFPFQVVAADMTKANKLNEQIVKTAYWFYEETGRIATTSELELMATQFKNLFLMSNKLAKNNVPIEDIIEIIHKQQ